MFLFLVATVSCDATFRKELRDKYSSHKIYSYKQARKVVINDIDCDNNKVNLIYGGNTYSWKRGQTTTPSSSVVNIEHIVPQHLFDRKTPYVSDLHHLRASPSKVNNRRGNNKFGNVNNADCRYWCINNDCFTGSIPSNPEAHSCLSSNGIWKPREADKGEVARAVLYFFTMYDKFDISSVGNVNTFIQWSNMYPPSQWEIERNIEINKTQGNSNPFVEDPSLVNKAWP